jgi:hypothetical protein
LTLTKICRPSLIFVPGMKTERVEPHTVHHREDRLLALRERAGLSRRPFPLANALAYYLKMCKLRRRKFRGTGLRNVQSLTLCSNSQNMHGLFGVFQSINISPTDIWSTNERTYIESAKNNLSAQKLSDIAVDQMSVGQMFFDEKRRHHSACSMAAKKPQPMPIYPLENFLLTASKLKYL